MQERPSHDAAHDESIQKPSLEGSFLGQRRYPGQEFSPGSAAAAPPDVSKPLGGKKLLTRVVLPLAIFVAIIATVAWITQNLPGRPEDGPAPPAGEQKPLLEFDTAFSRLDSRGPAHIAVWEPDKGKEPDKQGKDYVAEYEVFSGDRLDGGHYDFPFRNVSAGPVELGVVDMSCQCSTVKACALSESQWQDYQRRVAKADRVELSRADPEDGLPWTVLNKADDNSKLTVPPGGRGIVRLFWDGRKQEPEVLLLNVRLWAQPEGKIAERVGAAALFVDTQYVRAAQFDFEKLDIGLLGEKGVSKPGSFAVWSATRDNLVVQDRGADPCIALKVEPLEAEGRKKLQQELQNRGKVTRVRSAYRIHVTVHERKDGKQLDMGSFHRPLPVSILSGGKAIEVLLPVLHGYVEGDVRVETLGSPNKVDLKVFKAREGTQVTAKVRARPGLDLEFEKVDPPFPEIKAALRLSKEESTADWAVWELKVTVNPGIEPGSLPDGCAIVLRARDASRRIRIPLVGTAGRG